MGAFVISPLPPLLLESLQTAGPLRSADITPLPRYYGPLRHPLVFHRFPSVSGYTASGSADCSTGRGGFLQLLNMSLSPCCPYYPAGVSRRVSRLHPFRFLHECDPSYGALTITPVRLTSH